MILLIRLAAGLVATAITMVAGLLLLGFMIINEPAAGGSLGPDGTPLLLGQSRLNAEQLTAWWNQTGRTSASTVDGATLMGLYADTGARLGVRADLAVAQAVLETGYFEHFPAGPGGANNFAGIAVYDGATSGAGFPTATDGVTAHVALLREFADADFADAPVHAAEPGCCPTVGSLAGVWATDPDYAVSLLAVYQAMLASAGLPPEETGGPGPNPGGPVELATVEGITVAASIAPQVRALVTDAARAGLRLSGGGYRSPDQQIATRRANCGPSPYDIYEKPSSQCSPPTARPGTSMHERGLAIDFQCNGRLITSHASPCWRWLNTNAATYGLHPFNREPWHWSTGS